MFVHWALDKRTKEERSQTRRFWSSTKTNFILFWTFTVVTDTLVLLVVVNFVRYGLLNKIKLLKYSRRAPGLAGRGRPDAALFLSAGGVKKRKKKKALLFISSCVLPKIKRHGVKEKRGTGHPTFPACVHLYRVRRYARGARVHICICLSGCRGGEGRRQMQSKEFSPLKNNARI